jgi:aspartyl-tRNA(Asn)/glutamyl-tRNA(Gln) amidotransferase subunit C
MALSPEDVQKVALLSRLRLSGPELDRFTIQLNRIVGYVEQLQELDTEGVEPMAHPLVIENVFREDEVRDSLDRDVALQNAPKQRNGFYLVPPVLD